MNELIAAAKAVIATCEKPFFEGAFAAINRLRSAVDRAEKPPADFEEWFRGRLSPTYYETWQAAQQAERERIKKIIRYEFGELLSDLSDVMEMIDDTTE